MTRLQSGFTMIELLAYLSIIGVVSAGVFSGAAAIMREVNYRKDISEIKLMEKDIRLYSVTLDDFTPTSGTLEDFVCDKGIKICATGQMITSSGKKMTLRHVPLLKVAAGGSNYPAFFRVAIQGLERLECIKFAEEYWGKNSSVVCVLAGGKETCAQASTPANIYIKAKTACSERNATVNIYYK